MTLNDDSETRYNSGTGHHGVGDNFSDTTRMLVMIQSVVVLIIKDRQIGRLVVNIKM